MGGTRHRTRAQIDAVTRRGVRMHRCDGCGIVFVCDQCTDMMHQSQVKSYEAKKGDGCSIYSAAHQPSYFLALNANTGSGIFMEPKEDWLCDKCNFRPRKG